MSSDAETWVPIGAAAQAASVPRRTAFRWVRLNLVPVRQVGPRRCVEVGALRRLAAERHRATAEAPIRASSARSDDTGVPPLQSIDSEHLLAFSDALANVELLLNSLVLRFDAVERALRLR